MLIRRKQKFASQSIHSNVVLESQVSLLNCDASLAMRPANNNMATFRLLTGMLGVALTLSIALSGTAQGQQRAQTGSSSRSYRAEAIRAIPFKQINNAAGRRIERVVKNPSFYRRLPIETINADQDHFRFLVRKPEVIVSIWQMMGVTQMTAQRTAPYAVKTNDGAGTISDLELVYGNDNLHVFYGTGSYTGSLIKQRLTGRCVIVLQTRSQKLQSGTSLTNQLDIFLKVDNAAAALVTRTLQPLVGTTADHNFVESLKFVERLDDSTRSNGPGVKEMVKRLEIDESVRRDYFAVIDQVFEREYREKYGVKASRTGTQKIAKTSAPVSTNRASSMTSSKQTKSPAQRRALVRPQARLAEPVDIGNPAAHFSADTASTHGRESSPKLEGISVLVGGPRTSLSSMTASTVKKAATSVRLTDQRPTSGPVARSARELPPIVPGPKVDPSVFQSVGDGRYIPVHKVPR